MALFPAIVTLASRPKAPWHEEDGCRLAGRVGLVLGKHLRPPSRPQPPRASNRLPGCPDPVPTASRPNSLPGLLLTPLHNLISINLHAVKVFVRQEQGGRSHGRGISAEGYTHG